MGRSVDCLLMADSGHQVPGMLWPLYAALPTSRSERRLDGESQWMYAADQSTSGSRTAIHQRKHDCPLSTIGK
jgi:hypothetical protein